jgi:hypothetical protein
MTPERIEEIKPYFTNEQLDELSREYRTMPTDGEGYAIEPEYEGMVARGYIVKLISDVKTARTALEEAERKRGDTGNALEIKRMLLEKANYEAGRQRVFKESAERKLAEAQQTIAQQQGALEFYALEDNNNWWIGGLDEVMPSEVMKDGGAKARAARGNKEGPEHHE